MTECSSKGLLSFLIVWLVRKQPKTGAEIAQELEKRRGKKPSPGTVYRPYQVAAAYVRKKNLTQLIHPKKEYLAESSVLTRKRPPSQPLN